MDNKTKQDITESIATLLFMMSVMKELLKKIKDNDEIVKDLDNYINKGGQLLASMHMLITDTNSEESFELVKEYGNKLFKEVLDKNERK